MARILASTIALTQFSVTGSMPGSEEVFPTISAALSTHAFQAIDKSAEAHSAGWVQVDDTAVATFENPGSLHIDNLLLFSLRQDQRRIPAAVLNAEIKVDSDKFLKEHPNLRRVPKAKRAEIKELVTARLYAKTLPAPTVCDVAWDIKTGTLNLFANSQKQIDNFDTIFRKTFPEFTLKQVIPYHRAEQEAAFLNLYDELVASNQSNSDSLIALIRENTWIGKDFLLWLLAGCNSDKAAGFSAWIDNRLVMVGATNEGTQKITVAGDVHDRMPTIKTALLDGKQITSATVYIEKDENLWRFTLSGDTFVISGYRTPAVRMEREIDEQVSEFQAAILEKMFLLNTGMTCLHTLLRMFLEERLSTNWSDRLAEIQAWMEE